MANLLESNVIAMLLVALLASLRIKPLFDEGVVIHDLQLGDARRVQRDGREVRAALDVSVPSTVEL